jgi:hypothetical protein
MAPTGKYMDRQGCSNVDGGGGVADRLVVGWRAAYRQA